MPLFLEPEQRFPIVLDSDKDKPAATRPTFYAKSQSMRSQRKLFEEINSVFDWENKTTEQIFAESKETLFKNLLGWANMGGYEFSLESIEEVLSLQEVREILRKISTNQHVGPEEKKD